MSGQSGESGKPGRWQRPFIGPFTMFQTVAVLVAVAFTGLVLVFINTPLSNPATPGLPTPGSGFVPVGDPVEGLRIGDIAPELTGTTADGRQIQLTELDGNPITLAALRGRPVWINFWASWCPPCQEETPVLRDAFAAHEAEGLALVAISVQETTVADVRAYVERYSLRYTVGFDATSAIFHTYRAFGLPTQLFLDRDGVIRHIVLGPVTRAQVESILAPLLAD
jgi:peroxiredoxin